jgi:hypothetical protein
MRNDTGRTVQWALAAPLLALALFAPSGAKALEEQRGEEAAIKACDKRLCSILLQKNPSGEDLRCKLTKTWAQSKIKEADSHKLSWAFGDARCIVDLNLERVRLVSILEGGRRKLFVSPHVVDCIVEQNGKLEKVKATLAPKIRFRDGKADKVWVNLESVEGPDAIKATLVTAAYLADSLRLFDRQMVKAVNRYIDRHCPKTYPQLVATSPRAPSSKPSVDKK